MACLSICKHFTASAVFPPLTCLSLLQICLLSSKGFSLFSKHFLIHLNQSIKIKSHLAVSDRFYVFTGGWISSYTHPKSTLSFIFPPNAGNCSGGWSPSPRKAQTWPQQQGPLIPPRLMALCSGLCAAPVIPGNGIPFPSKSPELTSFFLHYFIDR